MVLQHSPSYRFRTIYVPTVLVEDLGVTHFNKEDKALDVRFLLAFAEAETDLENKYHLLHPYNALDCSYFDFLTLTDSQRKFLVQEVDYCTIRSMILTSALNVNPFFVDLVTKNQTLRALTTIIASNSDLTLLSLQFMQSKIRFDGPLIRDHRTYSEEFQSAVARIRISVDHCWTMNDEALPTATLPFLQPCPTPVGILYVQNTLPTNGDVSCPLFIQLKIGR